MKKKYLKLILFFSVGIVFLIPTIILASDNTLQTSDVAKGDLANYLGSFYSWAVALGGGLAIFSIAFAAIDYAGSGGDVEKINGAKEKIVGAVVGLLLLVLTYLILQALHTQADTKQSSQPSTATPSTSSSTYTPGSYTNEAITAGTPQTTAPIDNYTPGQYSDSMIYVSPITNP